MAIGVPVVLIVIVGIVVVGFAGLLGLKIVSVIVNAILGNSSAEPGREAMGPQLAHPAAHRVAAETRPAGSSGFAGVLIAGVLFFSAAIAIVGFFVIGTRSARMEAARAEELARAAQMEAVHAAEVEHVHAMQAVAKAMDELSEARGTIQDAVADTRISIPVASGNSGAAELEPESASTVEVVAVPAPATLPEVEVSPEQPVEPPKPADPPLTLTETVSPARDADSTSVPDGSVAASTEELPAEQPAQPEASEASSQEAKTDAVPPAAPSASAEAGSIAGLVDRKEELAQLGTTIAQLLKNQLDERRKAVATEDEAASPVSSDKDVVVFQLSEQMVDQILGESGREMLQSFNSELPGSIRQTYALVPLTPVGKAVTPVPPLIPGSGFGRIANSLISLVEIADRSPKKPEADPSSVVLATSPELQPMPDWVEHPGGRRIVAEAESVPAGEDVTAALNQAINKALARHLQEISAGMHPALQEQSQYLSLQLAPGTAQSCVMETWTRVNVLETQVEGSKTFHKVYALVEFPEAVDQAAVSALRRSVQNNRVFALGVIFGSAWFSLVGFGTSLRMWKKRTLLRRLVGVPVVTTLALAALLTAAGLTVGLSRGQVVKGPWMDEASSVRIDLSKEI